MSSENKHLTGSVKWFNSRKGFGFITPDNGQEDVFVHQSAVHAEGFRSLGEGEKVEFVIVNDEKGRPKALDVTGPNGSFVQGAPRRVYHPRDDENQGSERQGDEQDGGFRPRGRGGFRGRGGRGGAEGGRGRGRGGRGRGAYGNASADQEQH